MTNKKRKYKYNILTTELTELKINNKRLMINSYRNGIIFSVYHERFKKANYYLDIVAFESGELFSIKFYI